MGDRDDRRSRPLAPRGDETLVPGSTGRLLGAPYRACAVVVAVLAGLIVYGLAARLFPYHSVNHDEAVYLLQASMLLEGRVDLYAGELARSFRPWFFVEDGGRLYPKYAPVPAGVFAIGTALGEPRLSLALVATGNAALAYALVAAAWDRRTGVVAALALVASPLFLLSSSVFLPYAPATFLNLAFAFAYVRAVRRLSVGYAALAGIAVGLAFFARPYTAVLFAAPFIGHALWTLGDGVRRSALRDRTEREPAGHESNVRSAHTGYLRSSALVLGTVALFGTAFVLATLAYNRLVTGSAFVFPYEAFAPRDGPGFGRREILDHSIEYTPRLAVRANATLLWYLLTRWIVLGPIGAALAFVGAFVHVRGALTDVRGAFVRDPGGFTRDRGDRPSDPLGLDDETLRWLFVGIACSVVAGNVFFWGNYNVLATIDDPTDGLFAHFGPFYHFDLLLPLSGFLASGTVGLVDRGRSAFADPDSIRLGDRSPVNRTAVRMLSNRISNRIAERVPRDAIVRATLALLVLLALPVGVAVQAAVLSPPIERNAAYTAKYERAYAPFEDEGTGDLDGAPEDALVFVPTPYGDWLGHPFQSLRNDPDLRGETAYALDRDPESNFAVVDAYPDRDLYRYTYRGEWTPNPHERVEPKLTPIERRSGDRLAASVRVGVPDGVRSASVTVVNGSDRAYYDVRAIDEETDELSLDWTLAPNGTDVGGDGVRPESDESHRLRLSSTESVSLLVTLAQGGGSTLTYRLDLAVRTDGDRIEVLWPAATKVCTLSTDCGREGTYLPDRPDAHIDGVSIEATLGNETERADSVVPSAADPSRIDRNTESKR